jgi:hypothetical protein
MATIRPIEDGAGDKGVRMTLLAATRALAVAAACSISLVAVSGPAAAGTPVGSCTNSYGAYTYPQLAFDRDAQAIFLVIDTNRDGVICFKWYPNGSHAGHLGNLVDDKAAPHA